jgi:hypothetical protein
VQAVHCGGCRGWTRGWEEECPGIAEEGTLGTVRVTKTFVPRLSWRLRWQVLRGRQVVTETSAVSYGGGGGGGYTPPGTSSQRALAWD